MTTERFEVDGVADVYDADGVTVIGRIRSGTLYEGERRDAHWLMMRSPDGSPGYVKSSEVRLVGAGDRADPVEDSPQAREATPEGVPAADRATVATAASPPSSGSTGSDAEDPAGPQQDSPTRPPQPPWLLVGLGAVALVAIAIIVVVALSGSGDDDGSDAGTAIPEVEVPRASTTSIPPGQPADGEYTGQFEPEYFDDLGEGVVVATNELRFTVSDGAVTDVSGGWTADNVPVDPTATEVLCRAQFIFTHSIEAPGSFVDGSASLPVTVSLLRGPGEAEPTAPPGQDCGLPGDTEATRQAQITLEGQDMVVQFRNEDGEARGRVAMSRSDA